MASPSEHARDARIAAATCVLAGLAALAVALPAVWWESLHVDEATTLEYASHRFTAIVEDTFVERGGGPLSFFVEKATLWFPGGIEGLRGPSVLFFLAALPFAWLVGRRLVGVAQACALVFLLALAPLAVPLVTFARPYTPLLLGTLLAAWLSLRAADDPSRGRWIAAGVVAGLLPYVHPIAPLYAVLAFATGPLASRLSLREAARRAVPGAVALVVVALPYAYALAVLRRRYHVGYGDSGLLGTTHGRSVPEEALRGLAPDGLAGALLLAALAVLGLVLLWRSRRGAAIALALWIVVPVAFFTLVPVGGTRFFDRYLLPMLPAYLLLVATGCLGARAVGRVRLAVGGAAILGLLAWQALDASQRLRDLHAEQLPELVSAIPDGRPVLFAATGATGSSRPPELLDELVGLEKDVTRVDELPGVDPGSATGLARRGREVVTAFLASETEPRTGVWVLAGPASRLRLVRTRVDDLPGVATSLVADRYLVVRTTRPEAPRALVLTGARVREAWRPTQARRDRLVATAALVDRTAG